MRRKENGIVPVVFQIGLNGGDRRWQQLDRQAGAAKVPFHHHTTHLCPLVPLPFLRLPPFPVWLCLPFHLHRCRFRWVLHRFPSSPLVWFCHRLVSMGFSWASSVVCFTVKHFNELKVTLSSSNIRHVVHLVCRIGRTGCDSTF